MGIPAHKRGCRLSCLVDSASELREKETMRSLWTAFRFLSVFPWPRKLPLPQEIGRSTPFFPIVGLCLGLLLVFLNRILEPYLESEILGVVLITVLVLASRAQHLEGLRATFDQIGSGAGGEGRNGRGGIFGLFAVLAVVMLESRAIEVMGEVRSQGLLLAPLLGRWSMVILAYGSGPEQKEAGEESFGSVRGGHLFWATALALPLVILFSAGLGLWVALWVSLLTLLAGSYLHRRGGGVDGNNLRAIAEVGQALVMVLFASLY